MLAPEDDVDFTRLEVAQVTPILMERLVLPEQMEARPTHLAQVAAVAEVIHLAPEEWVELEERPAVVVLEAEVVRQ